MDSSDEFLNIKHKVLELIGRNILNYQLIEKSLKFIIKFSAIKILKKTDGELKIIQPKSERLMLGILVGKYLSDVAILAINNEEMEPDEIDYDQYRISISIKYRTELSNIESHSILESNIKRLVSDRNELVHHFNDIYSLKSFESYKNALEVLISKNKFSIEQVQFFTSQALNLENAIKTQAEFMTSDVFEKYFSGSLFEKDPDPENLH